MEEIQNKSEMFLNPDSIIAQLDVENGSLIADFGCGPGYFSLPFAKVAGEDGRVYALDVLPQVLETVASRAKSSAITNIVTARVNLEKYNGSKMESDSMDWVILKDILFQNQKKDVIIKEAHRILKTNGKVIVAEWNESDFTIGPEKELRISRDDLEKMFTAQGFSIEKNVEAGRFHYAFVAVK